MCCDIIAVSIYVNNDFTSLHSNLIEFSVLSSFFYGLHLKFVTKKYYLDGI